jgi:hypothetical protein
MVSGVELGMGVGGIGVSVGGRVLVGDGRGVFVGILVAVGALRVNSAEIVDDNCVASRSGPVPGNWQPESRKAIRIGRAKRCKA